MRSRCHMWTAPCLQAEMVDCRGRIACAHMSGLFARPHMSAGQDGFRDMGPKQRCDHGGHWHLRVCPCLGSIDHAISLSTCKVQHRPALATAEPVPCRADPRRSWSATPSPASDGGTSRLTAAPCQAPAAIGGGPTGPGLIRGCGRRTIRPGCIRRWTTLTTTMTASRSQTLHNRSHATAASAPGDDGFVA